MIRPLSPYPSACAKVAAVLALASIAFSCAAAAAPALAKQKPPAKEKAQESEDRSDAKTDKKPDKKKDQKSGAGEDKKSGAGKDLKNGKDKDAKNGKDAQNGAGAKTPLLVGTFGDWSALTAQGQGKDKTCYALAQPSDRQPAKLKRDPAYLFVSTRPSEGVRNEVAVIMGFPLKDNAPASADIDGDSFELVTTGASAWVKNPAKEKEFVEALKGGGKLLVKASSIKGNVTMDTYSLKGLSQALERVQKECR